MPIFLFQIFIYIFTKKLYNYSVLYNLHLIPFFHQPSKTANYDYKKHASLVFVKPLRWREALPRANYHLTEKNHRKQLGTSAMPQALALTKTTTF